MNFSDIFKDSFINGYTSGVDIKTIALSMVASTVLACYIFVIYRLITRKTFYSLTFNLSLVTMAIITNAIILTIQSNIVLSLGMVGALSIIRFRTAVKDPMDLTFLYWSISVGIICGAGLSIIAIVLCLIMSVVVLVIKHYPVKKASMLLVVNCTETKNDKLILNTVKEYCKNYKIKSKNNTPSTLDMVIELNIDAESDLLNKLMAVEGVTSASIISHDGEVTP